MAGSGVWYFCEGLDGPGHLDVLLSLGVGLLVKEVGQGDRRTSDFFLDLENNFFYL